MNLKTKREEWHELENEIISCRRCPRLVSWREEVARKKRRAFRDCEYWGKGVPGFGDRNARILVVGLAPGAHGSNRTGRMFTGDSSGNFLFPALFRSGFANQPESLQCGDGLQLSDIFITSVCRCAPPKNKPKSDELYNCRPFLLTEMQLMPEIKGMVALGRVAFENLLGIFRSQGCDLPKLSFAHNAFYQLPDDLPWIIASYHPSRQNTQTGRLTLEMFDGVWQRADDLLDGRVLL